MSSMFCEDLWMFTHVHPFPYTFLCSYLNIILSPVRSTISHYIGSRHRFRRQRRRRGRRQQETLLHHLCLRGALGARRCGARLGSKGCHGKIGKYAWWFSRIFMGHTENMTLWWGKAPICGNIWYDQRQQFEMDAQLPLGTPQSWGKWTRPKTTWFQFGGLDRETCDSCQKCLLFRLLPRGIAVYYHMYIYIHIYFFYLSGMFEGVDY